MEANFVLRTSIHMINEFVYNLIADVHEKYTDTLIYMWTNKSWTQAYSILHDQKTINSINQVV